MVLNILHFSMYLSRINVLNADVFPYYKDSLVVKVYLKENGATWYITDIKSVITLGPNKLNIMKITRWLLTMIVMPSSILFYKKRAVVQNKLN